jgi:phospholipid/cholesterol/gamma-HCH transport system ATP-binding protein
MRNGKPAIRFENVSKSFGARPVLEDVSLEVRAGSVFGILGRSGTGKSVTLKLMIGLLKPDRGRVFIGDTAIEGLNSRALVPIRKSMGFLFQNAALFDSISVGENVAFALRRNTDYPEAEIRERVQQKLNQVGLEKEYDKMPSDLSGGMRKRAGLARALALDPPILLVDEPSAGLDPITTDEIDDLLLGLKQNAGATLVVVTHNITSARCLGDTLLMLHEGRIIAQGTADELAASSHELVRAFMSSQGAG